MLRNDKYQQKYHPNGDFQSNELERPRTLSTANGHGRVRTANVTNTSDTNELGHQISCSLQLYLFTLYLCSSSFN